MKQPALRQTTSPINGSESKIARYSGRVTQYPPRTAHQKLPPPPPAKKNKKNTNTS